MASCGIGRRRQALRALSDLGRKFDQVFRHGRDAHTTRWKARATWVSSHGRDAHAARWTARATWHRLSSRCLTGRTPLILNAFEHLRRSALTQKLPRTPTLM